MTLAVLVPQSSIGASVSTLQHRAHRQQVSLHRWIGAVSFFRHHAQQARSVIGRHEMRRARVWVKVLKRELAETRAALSPRLVLPPHYAAWLCIHSHEGSWTDSGAPYWGGLQFGWNEWQRFGGRFAATANLATPLQQMWAAEAYWKLSGFRPWPNTARACGLL